MLPMPGGSAQNSRPTSARSNASSYVDDAAGRSASPRPLVDRARSSENSDAAFNGTTDYSKMNARRHNTARSNTFNTPSRLEPNGPTRLDKKWGLVGDMPFNDLLWVCEQSFRKESTNLSKDILNTARAEFHGVSEVLLDNIREPVYTLSEQIVGKIAKVLHEVEAPAKVDFTPVHEEFQSQRDASQQLAKRVSEDFLQTLQEIRAVQQQQQQGFGAMQASMQDLQNQVQDLHMEVMRRGDRQVTQVLNVQQSLSAEAAQVTSLVREIQQELRAFSAALVPNFEAQLCRHVHDRPVTVNFDQMVGHLHKTQEDLNKNMQCTIAEVKAMRGDLGRDIGQLLQEQQDGVQQRLEQLAEAGRQETVRISNLRDTWAQTEAPPEADHSTQTDGKIILSRKATKDKLAPPKRSLPKRMSNTDDDKSALDKKQVYPDGEAMKKRARQALIKPQYNVVNLYYETGYVQAVAKSWIFENLTLAVIFANSIWIAYEIDQNPAAMLAYAPPLFQVVESLFCSYFTLELLIRFLAFRNKRNCLRDRWFVFDAFLVVYLVIETWVLTITILSIDNSDQVFTLDTQLIRMLKLVKIVRLSRMARLLRMIPELVVLLKVVGSAARSIMLFFLLWLFVIYIYAVVFRQMSDGYEIGRNYFDSVPGAMRTLLLEGILPDNAKIMHAAMGEGVLYWPIMISFIVLTSITLMYMLMGVLVEVIAMVASTEKEGMVVSTVATRMRAAMRTIGRDDTDLMSKMDFQELLVQPDVASLCQEVGVNVVVLVDMTDVIYETYDKEGNGMTFESLIDIILNMRGTNPATVKDVKEQLRFIKGFVTDSQQGLLKKIARGFEGVQQQLQELRKCVDPDESSGPEMDHRQTGIW